MHFSLGSIYKVARRIAESIIELDRALQLAPNSDEGYRRLGAAYLANGRKEEAFTAFQKAVDLNPVLLGQLQCARKCLLRRWQQQGRSRGAFEKLPN